MVNLLNKIVRWRKYKIRKDSIIAYKKFSEKIAGVAPVLTTN
jgi:hypothetical protein